jgi:undecaprenyl-diphosphatase
MSFIQAAVMGLIQGLTEFLPVSSSGHLALFKILFHVNTDTGMLYDVLLHIATLIAIVCVYYRDVARMIVEFVKIIADAFYNVTVFFRRRNQPELQMKRIVTNSYRKFVLLVIAATIPTGLIGYAGADFVEAASNILFIPGICLIITAVLLYLSDRAPDGRKGPKQMTYSNALVIGVVQGIATMPGISRSGSTIAASVFLGLRREFAVKFSFLMSIPAILGALVLEFHGAGSVSVTGAEVRNYIIGMIIAGVVGYIAIKLMLAIVKEKKFKYFAVYCLIVGVVSVIGYAAM